jgi:hypothetical protein
MAIHQPPINLGRNRKSSSFHPTSLDISLFDLRVLIEELLQSGFALSRLCA